MTSPLRFVKVAGSGNDFVLVDGRRRKGPQPLGALARSWCDRKQGIGADGLLWIAPSRKADARMRIFNPDGSEAAMCGNGLRCVSWFLHERDHGKKRFRLETGAGLMETEVVQPGRIRIRMTAPRALHLGIRLTLQGTRYELHSVNTGVPHAVLRVRSLEGIDLSILGPRIRSHRLFQPAGTNVDLLRINGPHQAAIRTYERGVEQETLACGTGAVACVVIGAALGALKPPVQVMTAGGDTLTVGFRQSRKPWEDLYLEGSARILFEGMLPG